MLTTTCALFNARSLSNKLPDFRELLSRNYFMVFATESWLRNSIVDGRIDNTDQNYNNRDIVRMLYKDAY